MGQMTAGDWINLGNAISTFAAVAVALWLGVQSQRKASSEALTRAKLFAAGTSASLADTVDQLWRTMAPLYFLNLAVARENAVRQALVHVRSFLALPLYRPDDATLLALTPLPQHSAHRIARAFDLIETVRRESGLINQADIDLSTVEQREDLLKRWTQSLDGAHGLLKAALAECVAAAEIGAPMPTRGETPD